MFYCMFYFTCDRSFMHILKAKLFDFAYSEREQSA